MPVSKNPEHLKKYARLGRELKNAMRYRKISSVEMAAALGMNEQRVSNYRRGATVPRHDTVAVFADYLGWENLIVVSLELRTRTCPIDGVVFQDNSIRMNRVYCSDKCCRNNHARNVRGDVQVKYITTTRRLELHVDRVRKMCYVCAPDAVCWDKTCPLRDVSPFMLSQYAKTSNTPRSIPMVRQRVV